MDDIQPARLERRDRGRLGYWARLIKLLRDPWPPRPNVPARTAEASRTSEPTRQPAPARLDDA